VPFQGVVGGGAVGGWVLFGWFFRGAGVQRNNPNSCERQQPHDYRPATKVVLENQVI